MKNLLILIPSFNEEKNLPHVLNNLTLFQKKINDLGWDYDIVIIDDGSADKTSEIAQANDIKSIRLLVNQGYGAALQTGYIYAKSQNYDAILSMDADGQHQPKDILTLLKNFNGNYDVVLGSRFIKNTGYITAWPRRLGIQMFSYVLYFLTGVRIKDVTTGFQLVSKEVASLFAEDYPHDYPDAQVLLLLARTGFKIIEVPVKVKQRLSGHSMHSSFKSIFYPIRNLLAITVMMLRIPNIPKKNTFFAQNY